MSTLEQAQADLDQAKARRDQAQHAYNAANAEVGEAYRKVETAKRQEAAKVPVDRTDTTLTDGSPVTSDHRELRPDGMQKGYVVLSEAERAKGFVRPVRRSYVHQKCGVVTTMGQALAETYARDPYFYSGTYCCGCGTHYPVGEDGEFVWDGTNEKVGT